MKKNRPGTIELAALHQAMDAISDANAEKLWEKSRGQLHRMHAALAKRLP